MKSYDTKQGPSWKKSAVSFIRKNANSSFYLCLMQLSAKDNKTMAKAKKVPRPSIFVGGKGNEVVHNYPYRRNCEILRLPPKKF